MIVMARVAWAFNIAADPAAPIDSSIESGYTDGFVFSPVPFRAHLEVRSSTHEAIIVQEYEAAKAVLRQYET